jgi:hypothetical protein
MADRPRHTLGRIGMMLAAMLGSAAPPPEMLGAPKTEIVDQRKRKHKPRPRLRGMYRLWPWSDMVKHGWTGNGRGDRINPKRAKRRAMAATVLEYTGRKLSGRQWVKLRKGH